MIIISREKHDWYISLKKFKLEQWFPNISYLHFKKRRMCDGHLTNITNKHVGKDVAVPLPLGM